MIPVALAPEPEDFDTRVRQKGLDAIAELVGEEPSPKRPGRRRRKLAHRREDIPPDAFPAFWRDAQPDMLHAYGRICAYLSLYIEHATGSPTIDHVFPKSKHWDQVYEWSNYRLACALMNSKKSDLELALDPCEIKKNLFAIEFVGYQVVPGPAAKGAMVKQVEDTIATLGLNTRECCEARRAYVENYQDGHISLAYLERRAPFIAQEMRRRRLLHQGDA